MKILIPAMLLTITLQCYIIFDESKLLEKATLQLHAQSSMIEFQQKLINDYIKKPL